MFELTGRLDDMTTEVIVCVPTAAAPFFHWSLPTPIKVLHMTGLQQGLIVCILLPREVLKSEPQAGFHINGIVLSE